MTISNIELPIEQRNTGKGNPNAIIQFERPLNNRQQLLLDLLPEYDSSAVVPKKSVRMSDLASLTSVTGVEFAMFTKENRRLIIRGDFNSVNIDIAKAEMLKAQGYKWSGHTHPGIDFNVVFPSDGDKSILKCFSQKTSVIYNSKGVFATFDKE